MIGGDVVEYALQIEILMILGKHTEQTLHMVAVCVGQIPSGNLDGVGRTGARDLAQEGHEVLDLRVGELASLGAVDQDQRAVRQLNHVKHAAVNVALT